MWLTLFFLSDLKKTPRKHHKFLVVQVLHHSSLFSCTLQAPLYCSSLIIPLAGVFSTPTTTPMPEIALSTSHLLHWDKGSWKGVKGVRVSPRQCGRFCQRVACSHFSANIAPPNDNPSQSDVVFLWPYKLPGAQVTLRDRQTDHTACLGIIIQPCLTLSTPSSFLAHPFSHPPSCPRGLWPPLQFFCK